MIRVEPLGDRAFLARFANGRDAAAWAELLRKAGRPGVVDVVAAYETVGVYTDSDFDELEALEGWLTQATGADARTINPVTLTVPVFYDGEDLAEVAETLGLSVEEAIRLHSGTTYHVQALGFQPGFPYAGDLPSELAGLARLASPRPRVPAGSVAIVGRQTAIYPTASPGGWRLLGTTPLRIFDLETAHFPIRVGDLLRFVPIDRSEFDSRLGELLLP